MALHQAASPILGSIRSEELRRAAHQSSNQILPFITISRQAGAGGTSLAARLTAALNANLAAGDRPWRAFDGELVEKVAADHGLSAELIDSLEESSHHWLSEFLSGLPRFDNPPSDLKIVHHLAATVRALAQAGRTILVGRGGVMITQGMPGGIHVRLIAPLQFRVATMLRLHQESAAQAEARVRKLDAQRAAFYNYYWPRTPLAPERFALILNSAAMDEDTMTNCVRSLIDDFPASLPRAVRSS